MRLDSVIGPELAKSKERVKDWIVSTEMKLA